MTLNKRILLKVAEAIREHDQEVITDDVVGCLLTTAAMYSNFKLGTRRTLIQFAIQMAIVCDYDFEQMESAMIHVLSKHEHLEADPEFKKSVENAVKDTNKNN